VDKLNKKIEIELNFPEELKFFEELIIFELKTVEKHRKKRIEIINKK